VLQPYSSKGQVQSLTSEKKEKRMSKAKIAVPIKKAIAAPQVKAKAVTKKKDDDEAYTTKCGKP
jgi:hypothetical protein